MIGSEDDDHDDGPRRLVHIETEVTPPCEALLITFLVFAIVLVGGGLVAATAYQAGLSTAVTTVVRPPTTGTVVVPVAHGWGYGWGWGPGFGFLGFFGFLFVLFLVFGLIRAIVGPRRGWGGPGRWDGPGGPGNGHGSYESRARQHFDDWHRESHAGEAPPPAAG